MSPFKNVARALAWRFAPSVMAERARNYERRLREREGLTELARRFSSEYGTTVLHGPCQGLKYPVDLLLSETDVPIAKLLGTYEEELHSIFDAVISRKPSQIIDLGAAEGYYAVGLALACPQTKIIAFELANSARRALTALADANSVVVEVHGRATAKSIVDFPISEAAFVLCDIEGAESNVLSRASAEALATATLLVELHEHVVPGIADILRQRFPEHSLSLITATGRNVELSELADYTSSERDLALSEWRTGVMTWAVFRPNTQKG